MKNFETIILAAGRGTRMASDKPKILLRISRKTILSWIIELLKSCGFNKTCIVLGYHSKEVKKELDKLGFNYKMIVQNKLNGTAKGLQKSLSVLNKNTENILVLYGDDAGLYKPKSIIKFIKYHQKNKNKATFLVLNDDRISDIGGLEIDNNMNVLGVKTQNQIKLDKKLIYYILCGAFCFDKKWIQNAIKKVKLNPKSGEYPLPQIIEVAKNEGINIKGFLLSDSNEWESVNTKLGLKIANNKKNGK